jgi:hypothetical protein
MQEEGNKPELLAGGKGVPATVGLKAARGKVPSQRTEISYKASLPDKSAKQDEVRSRGRSADEVAAWEERQQTFLTGEVFGAT